jgi:hypothetical protein
VEGVAGIFVSKAFAVGSRRQSSSPKLVCDTGVWCTSRCPTAVPRALSMLVGLSQETRQMEVPEFVAKVNDAHPRSFLWQ